ncbi:MAG: ribosomal protein S18-alanine N-acetyltransferase [Dehalococcoidia bacterium]|nr:ribosomal protein S18-alanine N-acetyltransferase [Dehalococcoidia bacterium]
MENGNHYYIRKMKYSDIPQVLDIDLDAFPMQWPHPTTNSFSHELRNKLAHYIVLCKGKNSNEVTKPKSTIGFKEVLSYIAGLFDHDRFFGPEKMPDEPLIGMAGIWMMVDEAHIVTIALRKSYKRQGLGERLLIAIIETARQLNAKTITLEVRVSNTTAQALYTKYGFATAGTRRKYYSDNGEDALIMSTINLDSPSYEDMFQLLKDEHRRKWGPCYTE